MDNGKIYEIRRKFRQYPMALYATDVTFQPSFRLSGSVEEGKKYFSGKHKQYGYNFEVSVLPKRLALCCSECGITTHVPTTRKRGGFEVRERSLVGYPREGDHRTERTRKEGRLTWPVTRSRTVVVDPDGRSRVRSLRLKGKSERYRT